MAKSFRLLTLWRTAESREYRGQRGGCVGAPWIVRSGEPVAPVINWESPLKHRRSIWEHSKGLGENKDAERGGHLLRGRHDTGGVWTSGYEATRAVGVYE